MKIHERADEIATEFSFLDDWEMRYAHIIDLGKSNAPLDAAEKNGTTKVRGCASQVWLVLQSENDGCLSFRAESDSLIVSGLIVLLVRLLSGAKCADIKQFDTAAFLERIGVTGALSAQRANGLASILHRIGQAATTRAPAD